MSKFEPGIGREFPMEESAPRGGHRGFCGKHRADGHGEHAHHHHHGHHHGHAHHHGRHHGCRHGHASPVAE